MPIVTSDIELRLTIRTGSTGNATAQAAGALSLGKYLSTSLAPASPNDLFPLLADADNAAGVLNHYLCLMLLNRHASLTWRAPRLWLDDPAGGSTLAIAVDPTPASLAGSSAAQALEVASITTAPAGLTWSAPASYAAGLALGDIPAGYVKAWWIRRSAANSQAVRESPRFEWLGATLG